MQMPSVLEQQELLLPAMPCEGAAASVVYLGNLVTRAITNWFDSNGFACDPAEAEFAVVGPCDDGSWHTVELGQPTGLSVH